MKNDGIMLVEELLLVNYKRSDLFYSKDKRKIFIIGRFKTSDLV